MARWGLAALALWTCGMGFAQLTANPDFYYGSVIESFRKHDPQMVHFSLLYKGLADEELDVILVRGGRYRDYWPGASSITELFDGDLLGVFLVSRANPALAYELAIEKDLAARIVVERDVPGEITIRPFNDYGMAGMRRKYFYRASSKQLTSKRNFWPDGLEHAGFSNGQLMLWGHFPDLSQRFPKPPSLAVVPEGDGFRQIDAPAYSHSYRPGEVELLKFGEDCTLAETRDDLIQRSVLCGTGSGERARYTAPLADFARFAAARAELLKYSWTKAATYNESIGPYQSEGDGLWFGLTFYDGEGHTGVGGFGYFDTRTRQFEMHYLPELADWSVSALLVEEEAIWFALESRGEGQRTSGGLIRWDRATQEIVRWAEAPRALAIVRLGERLYMPTDEGAATFEDDELTRYLLDVDGNGEYRLVRRELR